MRRALAAAVFAAVLLAVPAAGEPDDWVVATSPLNPLNRTLSDHRGLSYAVAVERAGGPVAIGAAMAHVNEKGDVSIITTPKDHVVDASPVTDPAMQVLTAILMAIGTWVAGAGGSKLLSILHLQDSAMAHQILADAAKAAVGKASVALREKYAGKPWTIDAHNELVKDAGDFLVAHFQPALAKVGVTFGKDGELTEASRTLVDDKVEAVLGNLAIDAQKIAGAPHPVIAATTTPAPAPAGAPQGTDA